MSILPRALHLSSGSCCTRAELLSFPSGERDPLGPFLSEGKEQFYSKAENPASSTKLTVFLSATSGNECNGNEMKPGLVVGTQVQDQLANRNLVAAPHIWRDSVLHWLGLVIPDSIFFIDTVVIERDCFTNLLGYNVMLCSVTCYIQ